MRSLRDDRCTGNARGASPFGRAPHLKGQARSSSPAKSGGSAVAIGELDLLRLPHAQVVGALQRQLAAYPARRTKYLRCAIRELRPSPSRAELLPGGTKATRCLTGYRERSFDDTWEQ